jgi:hypothetical protein
MTDQLTPAHHEDCLCHWCYKERRTREATSPSMQLLADLPEKFFADEPPTSSLEIESDL